MPMGADRALLLNYGYLHVMWLFQVTFRYRYLIGSLSDDGGWDFRELTAEEAAAEGVVGLITIHWWWRYGLYLMFGSLIALLAYVATQGSYSS